MEELKLLVGMVSDLPSMALWVIAAFFGYKTLIVGSIYGVIRFVAGQLFDWLKVRKVQHVEVRAMIDGMCIDGTVSGLTAQLMRLTHSKYIHGGGVDRLRQAIDLLEQHEAAAGRKDVK